MLFGRHIVELNGTNNTLVRSYAWGLDLSSSLSGAGGVGGLAWMTLHTASGSASGTHFVCYDGNGDVVSLVSAITGDEIARYKYGPFGEPIRITGPAASLNSFCFSTNRTDNTTDLVLYEYRAYSLSTGRWPNRDPIADLGTIVIMFEAKDLERIKWVLPASPEAQHLLLHKTYYRGHTTEANPNLTISASRTADTLVVTLYDFFHNDPIQAHDPDGQVAQWLAACGVGACWGGFGGLLAGLGGGWRSAMCGALGGAKNGCCSGIICATLPQLCTAGSCICGALGSFAQQLCEGGFNYKDKCAWASLILSSGVGCLGGFAEDADDAQIKMLAWVTRVDISVITATCPSVRELLK
jgi:RHS repeat-associated protein